MDTREAKVQLPSYLIGDLSPKEAAMLEGHLDVDPEAKAAKESMSRQLLPVINLQAPEVSEAALNKLFVDARRELEKPVYQASTAWLEIRNIVLRVAAVLVVGAVLGLLIYGVTPTSAVGGTMLLATGKDTVWRYGDVIETSQGVPMTIEVKSTEAKIAMDGSAAVKVTKQGKEVVIEILRGRAIVSAGQQEEGQLVKCGNSSITVDKRSVAAIEYDTPFHRVVGNGAVVELQRQTINDVAREAERLYGGRIETTALPEAVAKRRISLYGVGLRKTEFLAAFKGATEAFGVTFKEEGKNFKLVYKETAGNSTAESESVLKMAPLAGTLTYEEEGVKHVMSERQGNAAEVVNGDFRPAQDKEGWTKAQRMVVWAGRTDMPYFKLDQNVSTYIAMGQSGGKVVVASALPLGTVITGNDSLRYKGALIKVGEKIKIELPGASGGTLLGVMSSGIEVAKDDAANTRYFVPVSASR